MHPLALTSTIVEEITINHKLKNSNKKYKVRYKRRLEACKVNTLLVYYTALFSDEIMALSFL